MSATTEFGNRLLGPGMSIRQRSEMMGTKRVEGDPTTCLVCHGSGGTSRWAYRRPLAMTAAEVYELEGERCTTCGGKGWVPFGPPVVGP